MTSATVRGIDRVEEFTSAVDTYEPSRLEQHADDFRVFARFISRAIDARYLDRHPPEELIPDDASVEIDAKKAAGYFTEAPVDDDELRAVKGRGLHD